MKIKLKIPGMRDMWITESPKQGLMAGNIYLHRDTAPELTSKDLMNLINELQGREFELEIYGESVQ